MLRVIHFLNSPLAAYGYRCHRQAATGASTGGNSNAVTRLNSSAFSYTSSLGCLTPIAPRNHRKKFTTRSHSKMEQNSSYYRSASVQHSGSIFKIKFCQWCGGQTKHDIPEGEEKMRAICTLCGKITYQNPKMVVGCLIEHDGKVLLCKRNIEPSYGLWTLPAGFLEIGESTVEGAIRETWEEAQADVEIVSPFAQLDIPLISQVKPLPLMLSRFSVYINLNVSWQTYIIFRARLKNTAFSPGPESSECSLFPMDEIPFDSLAFSSILATLNLYMEDVRSGHLKYHYATINKRPGSSPSDIHAYTLHNHLQS